jgi:hypothetical protein
MANGERKLLRELQPGDRVLVMNSQKQIEQDEVIMMLDSQPKRPGFFDLEFPMIFLLLFVYSFILFN